MVLSYLRDKQNIFGTSQIVYAIKSDTINPYDLKESHQFKLNKTCNCLNNLIGSLIETKGYKGDSLPIHMGFI